MNIIDTLIATITVDAYQTNTRQRKPPSRPTGKPRWSEASSYGGTSGFQFDARSYDGVVCRKASYKQIRRPAKLPPGERGWKREKERRRKLASDKFIARLAREEMRARARESFGGSCIFSRVFRALCTKVVNYYPRFQKVRVIRPSRIIELMDHQAPPLRPLRDNKDDA